MAKSVRKPRCVSLAGSAKAAFAEAKYVGPARKSDRVDVTVRLRRKTPLRAPASGAAFRRVGYETFRAEHGAAAGDVAKVEGFAHAHGLDVTRVSLAQRAVDLSGSVAAMEAAFGTRLNCYRHAQREYRVRTGPIMIPADLAAIVEGVFGLDNRPHVEPHFRIARAGGRNSPRAAASGFTPLEVARLYAFPEGYDGKGQTIAILEFGGGYRAAGLARYFAGLGVPAPSVTAVSVSAESDDTSGRWRLGAPSRAS
ncbi:MAG: protease pro-enzyme activation domain-containing protein [Casimicrobiaceae bacterium]